MRQAAGASATPRPESPQARLGEDSSPVGTLPFYFGPADRPLFGWLHRVETVPSGRVGLIICNPFGDEAIRAHRSLRHLAKRASRLGIPTIRFDYAGSGDSSGRDTDPDRLSDWIASIQHAANALRGCTGVQKVCFAGVRLGATLAALAATRRDDIAGLVAIAPVVNGKAYVRELRLLQRAIDSRRNLARNPSPAFLESAGFVLSKQTLTSLADVDLASLETPVAPRVLILDRAELPGNGTWEKKLRSRGTQAERRLVTGFEEMMLDNHESVVPETIISTTLQWISTLDADAPSSGPPDFSSLSSSTHGRNSSDNLLLESGSSPPFRVAMTARRSPDPLHHENPPIPIEEAVVRIGADPELFGIVSAPPAGAIAGETASPASAVLLLNAGAVHHVGPCRLHVALARYLAGMGYVVLRLDIGSIGDSEPHTGQKENDVYSAHAVRDIAEAIEYLRHDWGAREVIAAGVCSGAYHAFKAAVAHLPLRAVIPINPLTFFWKEGMSLDFPEHRVAADMMRYRSNVLSPTAWRKLVSGRVDMRGLGQVLWRTWRTRLLTPLRALARLLGYPLSGDLATELIHAARGGTKLHFVFAATDPGLEILRTHGASTVQRMQSKGRLGIELIEGADHTFTDLATRTALIQRVAQKIVLSSGKPSRGAARRL